MFTYIVFDTQNYNKISYDEVYHGINLIRREWSSPCMVMVD